MFPANDPEAEIIDPAVKGTLNVLGSCAKVLSVKRVVITSSIVAMAYNGTLTPDVVIDESWVSNPDVCRVSKNWYALSKTLAEEAAWQFAKKSGINLVTIHPGYVIGPFLQPKLNLSVELILNLVNGDQKIPCTYRFVVDVRDIAYAHIQALEVPTPNGRYLVVGEVAQLSEVLKILHQHYPTLHILEKFGEAKNEQIYQASKARAKSLGMTNFTPSEVSLKDTIESLKEKGFLNF